VQHLVILVLDLVIDELLALDAVVGKTACNGCKALSLYSVSAIDLNIFHTTYVKSSALDKSIGGALQSWPVTGFGEDSLNIFPQANFGNNWVLCASVAELET
jgi:hypothetical protein